MYNIYTIYMYLQKCIDYKGKLNEPALMIRVKLHSKF